MNGMLRRWYTTTDHANDRRVTGGCGHLHPVPERAVACSIERGDVPVAVDRAGKEILPDDAPLVAAFSKAARKGAA